MVGSPRMVVRKEGGRQEDASLFCSDEEGTRDGLPEFFFFPARVILTDNCNACKFCSCVSPLLCSPKGVSSMLPEVWDEETFWFVPEVLVLEVKLLIRTEKSFWFGRNQYLRQGLNWAQENNRKIKRLKTDWETKMAKYHDNRKLFSGKNTMNSYILLIKQWTHSRLAMYNIYVIPQFWNASYCGLS